MSAGLASSDLSPRFIDAIFFLSRSLAVGICWPRLTRTSAMLDESLHWWAYSNYFCKYLLCKYSHTLRPWGLELQPVILRGKGHSSVHGMGTMDVNADSWCFSNCTSSAFSKQQLESQQPSPFWMGRCGMASKWHREGRSNGSAKPTWSTLKSNIYFHHIHLFWTEGILSGETGYFRTKFCSLWHLELIWGNTLCIACYWKCQ